MEFLYCKQCRLHPDDTSRGSRRLVLLKEIAPGYYYCRVCQKVYDRDRKETQKTRQEIECL